MVLVQLLGVLLILFGGYLILAKVLSVNRLILRCGYRVGATRLGDRPGFSVVVEAEVDEPSQGIV